MPVSTELWDQQRFIRHITLVFAIVVMWFFANALIDGNQFRVVSCTLISVLIIISYFLNKKNFKHTGQVVLLAGFMAINSEIYTNGGLTSYATIVLVVVPVVAMPIAGKLSAYIWLCLSFLAYIGFFIAHESGLEIPNDNRGAHFIRRVFFDVSCVLFGLFALGLVFMNTNIKFAKTIKSQLKAIRKEAHLRHKAEQEAINASNAKSFFLANMSHEIRTPLNGIVGIVDLLNDAPLQEPYTKYIRTLNEASHLLLGQVNDILDFSKIESGEFQLFKSQFSIKECLEGLNALFKFSAEEKGLDFHTLFSDSVPDVVFSDEKCVRQVICNITSNAIKYTQHGSVFLVAKYQQGELIFSCTDTGLGISEDALEHLFEPFTQDYSDQKQFIQGTGLGLSITQSLCELLGGRIEVKSTLGSGTTFTVYLPMEPRAPLEEQFAKDHDIKAFNVLVAEDNPVNQMVIKGLLKKLGCQFHICEDGLEVLHYLNNNELPDVILSDIQMPNMNGYQLINNIREHDRFKHLHVAALTANATAEEHKKAISSGFNGFLTKPIERHKLLDYLSKI